ncbi:MAG: hypothetical protein HN769_01975 [Anaerolineae bacterium]|nr:hypothetical protein [Anaerolineae bacterium]
MPIPNKFNINREVFLFLFIFLFYQQLVLYLFILILPHKFRHGFAVYALKLAKDIAALKAVSQNLMHSSISITDGVYGVLSDQDTKEQIASLGQAKPIQNDLEKRIQRIEEHLAK